MNTSVTRRSLACELVMASFVDCTRNTFTTPVVAMVATTPTATTSRLRPMSMSIDRRLFVLASRMLMVRGVTHPTVRAVSGQLLSTYQPLSTFAPRQVIGGRWVDGDG